MVIGNEEYYLKTNGYGVFEIHKVSNKNGQRIDTVVAVRSSEQDAEDYIFAIERDYNREMYKQKRVDYREVQRLLRADVFDKFVFLFRKCYDENYEPKSCSRDDVRKLLNIIGKQYGDWGYAVLNHDEVVALYKRVINTKEGI